MHFESAVASGSTFPAEMRRRRFAEYEAGNCDLICCRRPKGVVSLAEGILITTSGIAAVNRMTRSTGWSWDVLLIVSPGIYNMNIRLRSYLQHILRVTATRVSISLAWSKVRMVWVSLRQDVCCGTNWGHLGHVLTPKAKRHQYHDVPHLW